MINMLPSMLLPLLPIIWAIAATVYWRRYISSPLLFAVAALLALFGIQSIVLFLWDYLPQITGNYIFESITSPAEMQRRLEQINRAAIIQAVVVFLIAIPFLWWLKNGLSLTRVH